jgi:hypothetical protein
MDKSNFEPIGDQVDTEEYLILQAMRWEAAQHARIRRFKRTCLKIGLGFFALALILILCANKACAAEQTNIFIAPVWSAGDSAAWRISKLAAFGARAYDSYETSQTLKLGHFRETDPLTNAFINSTRPATAQRLIMGAAIQYGFNLGLEAAYRHSTRKWERNTLIVIRAFLTGCSIRAGEHNRRLRD